MDVELEGKMEDLIYFPSGEEWIDTGEGGLAVYLLLIENNRQKCSAGHIVFPCQDVVVSPEEFVDLNDEICSKCDDWIKVTLIDFGMLVASTKKALWNKTTEEFFQARESDLTEHGKVLYDLITKIYDEKPVIVTLLDT